MSFQLTKEMNKFSKRKKLLAGLLILSLIEIICFYFMSKPYNFLNGLDDFIRYIIIGNILFFVAYLLLLEKNNIRKKYMFIIVAYLLLIATPFLFYNKIPQTNLEDAQSLIVRSEGGKVIKDRDYEDKIKTYEGEEVYLIAIEKGNKVSRFAFDPETQRYYSFK